MTRARDLADSADKDIAGTLTLDDLSVSGTVTGNVTGDLTGDVTGDVTGNLTGDVTGGLTGNVTGDVDLYAISATIADTAVDIFVYDTRKDSDGGQWRHRCQHTSWYNETLNTATRGSRKEFPAVAVIVAEQEQITIYDGDDPDLPMWMVFNTNSGWSMLYYGTGVLDVSAVAMLNGKLCVTSNNNPSTYAAGVTDIDFVKDRGAIWYKTGSSGGYSYFDEPISGRNVAALGLISISSATVVHYNLNDVAMTVLPNAPIDAATGLPVPTIAVATDGGISVIRDDGTVVDYTGTSQGGDAVVDQISFIGTKRLMFSHRYASEVVDLVSSDDTAAYYNQLSSFTGRITNSISHDDDIHVSALSSDNNIESIALNDEDAASKSVSGLSLANHYQVTSDPDRVSCFITSDYNTGWMNGDIKLATLSDTDDTNVTFTNLVSNGDFATGVTGWTASGDTSWSYNSSNQTAQFTGTSQSWYKHTISTESGAQYVMTFEIKAAGSGVGIRPYIGGNTYSQSQFYTAVGVHSVSFVADGTSNEAVLNIQSTGGTWEVDNVTVSRAEEDRSVNGNGLQVFGTVTKSAVATGADLVAYSGFSTNGNYLQQPYNSDLDVGTGDFSVMLWVKRTTNSSFNVFISRGEDSANNRWAVYIDSNNQIKAAIKEVAEDPFSSGYTLPQDTWTCVCLVRRDTVAYLYVNGELTTSGSANRNLTNTSGTVKIGVDYNEATPAANCSVALARISTTAPSPEQIKKIYEDEKVLFQDNAQATLYGSSDAVTALAYDDSTNLLHVGTSAGRSVFQGLRRVDNTTTAVGAAISASNGLVADE